MLRVCRPRPLAYQDKTPQIGSRPITHMADGPWRVRKDQAGGRARRRAEGPDGWWIDAPGTGQPAVQGHQLRPRRQDAQYLRMHADPWATRRLRGRSSGDRRFAKRPDLTPVEDSGGD